jgi:hypothetical protein
VQIVTLEMALDEDGPGVMTIGGNHKRKVWIVNNLHDPTLVEWQTMPLVWYVIPNNIVDMWEKILRLGRRQNLVGDTFIVPKTVGEWSISFEGIIDSYGDDLGSMAKRACYKGMSHPLHRGCHISPYVKICRAFCTCS